MNKFSVFILFALITLICWSILPQASIISDSKEYVETSKDLSKTEKRLILYPLLIKITQNQKILTFVQALICAGIFLLIYQITNIKTVIIAFIFGTYFVYIPYVMTDLIFSFFIIASYYFLKEKKLIYHFIFILLASFTRPVLAWFFLIEPILVYLVYKNSKKAILSFFISESIIYLVPVLNLIINNHFVFSTTFKYNIEMFSFDFQYLKHMIFGNFFTTHWNKAAELYGFYKRDLTFLKQSIFINWVNILFYFIYIYLYIKWIYENIKKPDWFNILWVCYFSIPGLIALDISSRMRLPWEFLLYSKIFTKNNQ